MSKTLGLDLGTSSIGWAIIDDENDKIIDLGVRIFPEGVENLGQGEKEISNNAKRREARQTRRQYFRKRLRKNILLKFLAKHQMCPANYTDKEEFNNWCKQNPYKLRAKAIHNEISLKELGRIFYHMIQRRGFLSSSKSAGAADEKSVIFKGKADMKGITDTQNALNNKTLGEYLYTQYPKENTSYQKGLEKIRTRYTTRAMYLQEFEDIWDKQKKYHKELNVATYFALRGKSKNGKDGILFYQRSLKSQKSKIGNCSFEINKRRAPTSCLPFQKFRVWQQVNNIQYNGNQLNEHYRKKAYDYLVTKKKVKFGQLRKALGLSDASYSFKYLDDDNIAGSEVLASLSNNKAFGKQWFTFENKKQEQIWETIYFYDDIKQLKELLQNKWNVPEKNAEFISKIVFKKDYASLSRKAINNILPFLEKGYTYGIATTFGGIKNAFGKKWNSLSEQDKAFLDSNVPEIVRSRLKGGYINSLKKMLVDHFNFTEPKLNKLYHHSEDINKKALLDRLPTDAAANTEIQNLRNPVVSTGIFELRRVVNDLIDRYGTFEEIKVELARDLKNSKSKRQEISREQKKNKDLNSEIEKELIKLNQNITHDSVLKYKLWLECKHTCPYTGRNIPVKELFNNAKWQIEHIIPYSRSLNNSFSNLTLCESRTNAEKSNKTPYEYYKNTQQWEEVKKRALSLFKKTEKFPNSYNKFKRFVSKNTADNDEFISRQLNDTRYFSREAKKYLTQICNNIMVSPGMATARLRRYWGLNYLLNQNENEKIRDDNRHHAIDALVVAATNRSFIKEFASYNPYNTTNNSKKAFPKPWESFRADAEEAIHQILVSYKRDKKILTKRMVKTKKKGVQYSNESLAARGQLHNESVYGKDKNGDKYYIRKPLSSFNKVKQIYKIADDRTQKILLDHLDKIGVDIKNKNASIPTNAFIDKSKNGTFKSAVFMPNNKNGDRVPIYKVRVIEHFGNAVELKDNLNQFVDLQNNHHILIYKDLKGDLQEDVVSFWVATERKKQGLPVYQLPENGKQIVSILRKNDMFILNLPNFNVKMPKDKIAEHLYRIQNVSSEYYVFRLATEAKIKSNNPSKFKRVQSFKKWLELAPVKVNISPSGHITKATNV